MNIITTILIGITFASLGQVCWKIGMNSIGSISSMNLSTLFTMISNPFVLAGLAMYGLSTVFWLIALSKKDLSYVYPFIALTFIIVLTLSKLLLNEEIGTYRLIGSGIILLGLMLIVKS